MKVAVVGSRNFTDKERLRGAVSRLTVGVPTIDITIVSGGAIGADTLGAEVAIEEDYGLIEHLPDRAKYGWPRAAFERNTLIVEGCQPGCSEHPEGTPPADVLLAFFGPGEPPMRGDRRFGSGTMDTVQKAMRMRKPVHIYFQKEG